MSKPELFDLSNSRTVLIHFALVNHFLADQRTVHLSMARFPEGPGEQPCQQRQSMSPKSLRTGFGTTICESKACGTYAPHRSVLFAPKRSLRDVCGEFVLCKAHLCGSIFVCYGFLERLRYISALKIFESASEIRRSLIMCTGRSIAWCEYTMNGSDRSISQQSEKQRQD